MKPTFRKGGNALAAHPAPRPDTTNIQHTLTSDYEESAHFGKAPLIIISMLFSLTLLLTRLLKSKNFEKKIVPSRHHS